MEFAKVTKRKKVTSLQVEGVPGAKSDDYPHALQLYDKPPLHTISLQEFEEFAVERLKVLKAIESYVIKNGRNFIESKRVTFDTDLKDLCFKSLLKKNTEIRSLKEPQLTQVYNERMKDHISHFILRLAYCRSEELKRWFLTQEMDLFRFRFLLEDDSSTKQFLESNKLNYIPISQAEKSSIADELSSSTFIPKGEKVEDIRYYKVPFTEALDLVRGRRVFVKDGFAYVPHGDLVVIITSVFRTQLSHALAVTARALPHLEEDGRLLLMLNNMSNRYLGQDYNTTKNANNNSITADMLDSLAKRSFPLCMQQLHQAVRREHHLRHWGRMQYGLFLKGIGLSLEEAVRFWRSEFTKVVDLDKFDKQYMYNIRHNYGKEGKRADYTPYSCIKIITTNAPSVGDHHGCPFKHSDGDILRQKLEGLYVQKEARDEILDFVRRGHYQLACGRYFNHAHSANSDLAPNHPNQYFDESQRLLAPSGEEKQTTSRGVKIVPSTSQNSQVKDNSFDDDITLDEDMETMLQSVESSQA